jgi:hypothetical protein
MSITRKLATFVTLVAMSLTASGCVPLSGSGNTNSAIEKIAQKPMPGFFIAAKSSGDSFCALASYCSVNASAEFTADKPYESRMDLCEDLIKWAPAIGVDSWLYDPDYIALPIKGHEGAAQFACIDASNFALSGSTDDVRWMLSPTLDRYMVTTIMSNEGGIDDPRMTLKSWDDARAELFDGTRRYMDILSALETYRLAHPDQDPASMKTVMAALKPLKLDSALEVIKDAEGKAHYISIPADQVMLAACLNIKPFDEKYFQMKNPGSGFVGLYLTEDRPVIDEFGYITPGECGKP